MSGIPARSNATRIDIWHNVLWAQYKGEIFSALYALTEPTEFELRFFQIAETERMRSALAGIDLGRHRYPYTLLFRGPHDNVLFPRRVIEIVRRTVTSDANLIVLAGYDRAEYWLQLAISRLRGRQVAVFCDSTIHDRKQSRLRGLFKQWFFRRVGGVFCYGERSKQYAIRYGAPPTKVFSCCQAAALPPDYTTGNALTARLQAAPSLHAPRFLYVGRFADEKGLRTLVNAFATVRQHNQQATLVLVGSGPERAWLEARAATLGIQDSVRFVGSKSGQALLDEYAAATALVLPSLSEPWGLVVNEALSNGCPVIVSDRCGCVPELVLDGQSGVVHIAGDVEDLAAKMSAAPLQFASIEKTAAACLAIVSDYTPPHAAARILAGIRAIVGDAVNREGRCVDA